jgi:hypothetical protein
MKISCFLLVCIQSTIVNAFSSIKMIPDSLACANKRHDTFLLHDSLNQNQNCNGETTVQQRRTFLKRALSSSTGVAILSLSNDLISPQSAFAKSTADIKAILPLLKEARSQLDPVPRLIKEEKWDSVRAILITPPLVDCWGKTTKPLIKLYAEVQDDLPNGDEFAVLELKEEALDHFRFLDMAVYNNVFNPIRTEGESGATKELIRSYYEDPVKEYQACKKILDDLIALAE